MTPTNLPQAAEPADTLGRDFLVPPTQPGKEPGRAALRRLPHVVLLILKLTRDVDPRGLTLLLGAETLGGLATAAGLLGAGDGITTVFATGGHAAALIHAWPALAVMAAAAAVSTLVAIANRALRARIAPRLDNHTGARLLEVTGRAELAAYDDPDWQQAKDAADSGMARAALGLASTVSVLSSVLNLVAALVVLCARSPLLAPLLLLAVVPDALSTAMVAGRRYASAHALLSATRWRHSLIADMTYVKAAPEVRAHRMRGYLTARYRAVCALLEAGASMLGRDVARIEVIGSPPPASGCSPPTRRCSAWPPRG